MRVTIRNGQLTTEHWPLIGEWLAFWGTALTARPLSWLPRKKLIHPKPEAFCSTGSVGQYIIILSLQCAKDSTSAAAARDMNQLLLEVKQRALRQDKTLLLGPTWIPPLHLNKHGFYFRWLLYVWKPEATGRMLDHN